MRVTDEDDPFFLFNLSLAEEDFQGCVCVTFDGSCILSLCVCRDNVIAYTQ